MRQHLIVDADDTLWENNIYFERAFDEFIDFLGHSSLQPREVRAILDEIEIAFASQRNGFAWRWTYTPPAGPFDVVPLANLQKLITFGDPIRARAISTICCSAIVRRRTGASSDMFP